MTFCINLILGFVGLSAFSQFYPEHILSTGAVGSNSVSEKFKGLGEHLKTELSIQTKNSRSKTFTHVRRSMWKKSTLKLDSRHNINTTSEFNRRV